MCGFGAPFPQSRDVFILFPRSPVTLYPSVHCASTGHGEPGPVAPIPRPLSKAAELPLPPPQISKMLPPDQHSVLTSLPKDIQVLWKLKGKHEWDALIESKLDVKDRSRFKIVDWIVPDPNAIMSHPNILCYVHHGGANSFFECCL